MGQKLQKKIQMLFFPAMQTSANTFKQKIFSDTAVRNSESDLWC